AAALAGDRRARAAPAAVRARAPARRGRRAGSHAALTAVRAPRRAHGDQRAGAGGGKPRRVRSRPPAARRRTLCADDPARAAGRRGCGRLADRMAGRGALAPAARAGGARRGRGRVRGRRRAWRSRSRTYVIAYICMSAVQTWDGSSYDRISAPMESLGREVLARLELNGDELVIDAGCGSGRITEALLARLPRGKVIAVDGSASMIEAAARRLAPAVAEGSVELRQLDLLELELEQHSDALL